MELRRPFFENMANSFGLFRISVALGEFIVLPSRVSKRRCEIINETPANFFVRIYDKRLYV